MAEENSLDSGRRDGKIRYVCARLARADDHDDPRVVELLPGLELRRVNDPRHILQSWYQGHVGLDVQAGAHGDGIASPLGALPPMFINNRVSW